MGFTPTYSSLHEEKYNFNLFLIFSKWVKFEKNIQKVKLTQVSSLKISSVLKYLRFFCKMSLHVMVGTEVLTYGGSVTFGFHTAEPFYLHFLTTGDILLELVCLWFTNFTDSFSSVMVILCMNFSLLINIIFVTMVTYHSYCFRIERWTLMWGDSLIISK